MLRIFEYFRDIHIRPNHIHVETTGAEINIDKDFMRDALTVLKIYTWFKWRQVKSIPSGRRPVGTIAFYPYVPGPWYNIWQVSRLAGLATVSDMSKADYIFVFEDKTICEFDEVPLMSLPQAKLNLRISDITKEHVADIFEQVFGYPVRIDPLTYTGPAIQKSNGNGKHDGVIIQCPLAREDLIPGQTYQKLVDSTFGDTSSEDLRIAFALGQIALVYHKRKPLGDRFGTDYLSVDILKAEDVFSAEEIGLIIKFCGAMGLDFGAVDVMRDKHNGRIYIVDVNKTCMPVLSLALKDQISAQQTIADALRQGLS